MQTDLCNLLDDYLDDLLDARDSRLFRQHMAACLDCAKAVAQQQELDDSLRAFAGQLHAPQKRADAAPRSGLKIGRDIQRPAQSPDRSSRHLAFVALLVAACLLVAFLVPIDWSPKPGQANTQNTRPEHNAPNSLVMTDEPGPPDDHRQPKTLVHRIQSISHIAAQPIEDDDLTIVMLYPRISAGKAESNED